MNNINNEEKICPLMSRHVAEFSGFINGSQTTFRTAPCQKGGCAFWDSHVHKCGHLVANIIKIK